jgi:hypothetical protein
MAIRSKQKLFIYFCILKNKRLCLITNLMKPRSDRDNEHGWSIDLDDEEFSFFIPDKQAASTLFTFF